MRRNKGRGSQQPAEAASPHTRALPAHLRASSSPEPWSGGDSGADEAPFESVSRQYDTAMTNEPSPLGRRPQRKAAGAARCLPPPIASAGHCWFTFVAYGRGSAHAISVRPARVRIPSAQCCVVSLPALELWCQLVLSADPIMPSHALSLCFADPNVRLRSMPLVEDIIPSLFVGCFSQLCSSSRP